MSLPEHFSSVISYEEKLGWAASSLMTDEGGCHRARACFEPARWDTYEGLVVTLPAIVFSRASLSGSTSTSFRLEVDRMPAPCGRFAILPSMPLDEPGDSFDPALCAEVCEVIRQEANKTYVGLLGRVYVYKTQHLEYHRDDLHPGLPTLYCQSGRIQPREEREQAIWDHSKLYI